MKKIGNTNHTTFDDIWNDPKYLSDEDKSLIEFEVELIGKMIQLRNEKRMTQKDLAEAAGLKQSAVARLESLKATPQLNTLLKVLKPLGFTLEIVPRA